MTPEQAVDAILDIFKAAWDTTGYPALYDDKSGEIPTSETPWARATIKHATGAQSTLAGASGTKRFTETGTLFVQVFTPVGDGSTACYKLAKVVRDAYRDARDPELWFRNVFLEEIGINKAFRQINVQATFSYDEVR
jgi:hypothetical protein